MLRIFSTLVLAATLGFAAAPQSAQADTVFRSDVVGPQFPDAFTVFVDGIPNGLPWIQDEGRVRIKEDGTIRVILKDFVLGGPNFPSDDPDFGAFEGTTGGVTAIFASLACLQEGGHVVVADTDATELDEDGDARLRDTIALPELCMAPLVLIRIALPLDFFGVWIAASGF